jgi:rhodanese-related sulfurtransferase
VYWPETAVATYGCINTSVRVSPMTIADNTILNLNPDETVVTYCWTGQTSSMVTAYLNVIGYNALSLSFGINGMRYDELVANDDPAHTYTTRTVDLPTVQ